MICSVIFTTCDSKHFHIDYRLNWQYPHQSIFKPLSFSFQKTYVLSAKSTRNAWMLIPAVNKRYSMLSAKLVLSMPLYFSILTSFTLSRFTKLFLPSAFSGSKHSNILIYIVQIQTFTSFDNISCQHFCQVLFPLSDSLVIETMTVFWFKTYIPIRKVA